MNQMPLVAIVIVNYNGYELTSDCLRSFAEITYPRYVLIVVDNASNDNSTQKLQEEFPHVHYLQNEFNLGFTGGNNLGIQKAADLGSDYIFFLNNDTIVSENILSELISFVSHNPKVGIVAPLTYYYESRDIISFGGGNINRNTGMYSQQNKGKTIEQLEEQVIYCSFIEGAAMFMSTSLAVEVGGFSDVYFLTSEESELCIRVSDKGYKLVVITTCSVWHKVSQTLKGGSTLRDYFIFRNKLLFVKRNSVDFGCKDFIDLVWFYGKCFASSILKDKNLATAKGILLGVFDFCRGKTGPGRYAKRLNAKHE